MTPERRPKRYQNDLVCVLSLIDAADQSLPSLFWIAVVVLVHLSRRTYKEQDENMQTTRITNNLSMMPIITMEDAHLIAPKTKKTMTPLHFPKQHLDKDKDKKRDSSWSSTSKSRRPKNPKISHEKTKKTKLSTWLLSWPKTIPRSRQNSIDDTDISSSSIVSTDPLLEGASTVDNNRNITTTTASSFTTELGRLPHDLLVHMLSFAGPRVVTNLAQTSRHFQEELTRENEAVWNILGVAYGKVNERHCEE